MYFQHSPDLWRDFPELTPGVLAIHGITNDVTVDARIGPYHAIARDRLAASTEAEFPEIQAWRRTFSKMGLKPTGYRCASEALLRRFRKEGSLPRIHPLIDLCNAFSLAYATPIAVIDSAQVRDGIEVRYADGSERYQTFAGELEHPDPREVIFVDAAGQAHARRWTNRQSGASAVRDTTSDVLIVAEAMHATGHEDIPRLMAALAGEIEAIWSMRPHTALLRPSAPLFTF
jgi:DNA/RNA-binding domain of Phe-tRNA-synthetase-like protein